MKASFEKKVMENKPTLHGHLEEVSIGDIADLELLTACWFSGQTSVSEELQLKMRLKCGSGTGSGSGTGTGSGSGSGST